MVCNIGMSEPCGIYNVQYLTFWLTSCFSFHSSLHHTLMFMHVWFTCSYTTICTVPWALWPHLPFTSRFCPHCHIVSALLLPPGAPSHPPHSPPLKCGGGNAEGAAPNTQPLQVRKRTSRFQSRTIPKGELFFPSPCTSRTCPLSWMKMATWASLTCLRWTSCLRASNTSCPSSHHLLCPASSSFSSFCCLPHSLYPTHLHCLSHWHCASAIWSPRLHHSPPRLPTAFRTVQMTRCVRVCVWPFRLALCGIVSLHFDLCITRPHHLISHNFHVPDLHASLELHSDPLWNVKLHVYYQGLKIVTHSEILSLYKFGTWQSMMTNTCKKPW